MPTLSESGIRYFRRILPGIGPVKRSLGTRSKEHADALELMVVTLARTGRRRLVRAWLDRRVSIEDLYDAHLSERLHELEERLALPDVPPLSAAIRAALKYKGPNVAASTLERYREGLVHFEAFAGSSTPADEALTEDVVVDFKSHRLDQGAAPQTVNKDLQAVSVLVSRAMKKGWITERPTKDVPRFEHTKDPTYMDPTQVGLYLLELRPRFQAQMQLLLSTGLRLGESEALTVEDVKGGLVRVKKSKTPAGIRTVSIGWAAGIVDAHIEENGLRGSDRLFASWGSFKYPKRRTVQKEHDRACRAAGITGYSIHNHRDTFAGDMAQAGMPLGDLQKILGHKHVQTTMVYASRHPDYNRTKKFYTAVADKLGKSDVRVSAPPPETADQVEE